MRLSTILLLPISLVLAIPAAEPVAAAEPAAAPMPTLAARLADSALAANIAEKEKRQLAITLFGATAMLSNGVICGGIGPLTGCLGTPGTASGDAINSVNGTIRPSGGTVTGDDFSILFQIPTPTGTQRTTTTSSDNGAAAIATDVSGRLALAAGVGAVALGLL